ncbi:MULTISPECIES: hypothetical protein [Acetobacter]|jgi:hypothetical protein|uniref:hypothetical protein n=1 Tax=Acetobacter TaxID=434 RepID=UPI002353D0B8|nr:hypothetical protein [Acetobacter peroxydans]MCH4144248.1 hypothetical protein [Acetobacter peroxydans]MCI1395587.1 hypothetical protein [Acetobacter peroxydans]MCI1412322.1 hypothetical protein [Acetobacter peroxydans]MCI1439454.1 hypothetical protein [Acetobacter peroxydans]MCI1567611.1 hypothetical protein [Acetobacter peroxydans]
MTDSSDKTAPQEAAPATVSAGRDTAPRLSARAQAAKAERQDRQAAALRANLLRRKAQARSRQDADSPAEPTPSVRPETGKPKPCP